MPDKALFATRLAIISASVALFMGALNGAIVSIALPTIASSLRGVDHLSWIMVSYLLSATIAAPICGKLGDIYGRKPVLIGAVILFLAGSLLSGLAWSIPALAAARFIQGLGGGALSIAAVTAVAEIVPAADRARIQSRMTSLFTVSSLIGPFVGGAIIEVLSWHWIFFLNIPVGLAVLGAIMMTMQTPPRTAATRPQIDLAGLLLLSSGLAAGLLAASLGGKTLDWTSPILIALIGASALLLTLFFVAERRAPDPVLPLSLFRNNTFSVLNLTNFLVAIAMYAEIIFLPVYLQAVKGMTPTASGLYMLPMMVGMTVSLIASGNFVSANGRSKELLLTGGTVMTLGFAGLVSMNVDTDPVLASLFMLAVGVGMGPILSVSVPVVQNAVPERMLGSATASLSMSKQIGSSLGSSLSGVIFAGVLAGWGTQLAAAGMPSGEIDPEALNALEPSVRAVVQTAVSESVQTVFAVAFVISLLSVLVLLPLRDPKRQGRDDEVAFQGAE